MSRQVAGQGTKPHKWRGRWRAALTIGYDRDGKQLREWVYAATRGECQDKLDKLKEARNTGIILDERITLGQWLDEWLSGQRLRIKARTVDLYERDVNLLGRRVKSKQLRKITARDLEREIQHVATAVSADAANKVRATLRAALEDAAYKDLISVNPAKRVRRVEHEPKAVKVWTAEQVLKFTRFTAQGRPLETRPGEFEACHLHAFFYLALTTGARSGELIALTWDDIQGDELHITKTVTGAGENRTVGPPKSKAGRRVNQLPVDTLAALHAHRERLATLGLESAGLVFPAESGLMLDSSNVGRALKTWARLAGIRKDHWLTPHELRHTYASMAISAGMTPVDLARQIGHADPGFTLKRYAHFFERATRQAAPSLEALTGAVDNSPVEAVRDAGSGIRSGIPGESGN